MYCHHLAHAVLRTKFAHATVRDVLQRRNKPVVSHSTTNKVYEFILCRGVGIEIAGIEKILWWLIAGD
jgi:hypothetical protein